VAALHPSSQLHALVWTALRIFDAYPDGDQDAILTALVDEAGLLPEAAWALYQVVPVAMTHAALRPQGCNFPTHFLAVDDADDIDKAERRPWTDDPLYVSALEVADHLLAPEGYPQALARAMAHSAEMNLLCQLTEAGCDPTEIAFSETVVIDFSALRLPDDNAGAVDHDRSNDRSVG
jgi:hypothetical protein